MNYAITIEVKIFLITILWGALILLAYDVFRILRRLIKHNGFFVAVQDLIFWVAASVFIFAMIYKENNGIIRGFCIMGMAIGMVLYHYILSNFIVNTVTKVIHIILKPLTILINAVRKIYRFISMRIKQLVKLLAKRLKKSMKSVRITLAKRKQAKLIKQKKKEQQTALEKKKKTEQKNSQKKSREEKNHTVKRTEEE